MYQKTTHSPAPPNSLLTAQASFLRVDPISNGGNTFEQESLLQLTGDGMCLATSAKHIKKADNAVAVDRM